MTIAVNTASGRPCDDGVAWRSLHPGLWVARRGGKHLGTIEHGRRWGATDPDGEPIGAFRTFREAQAAVADPAAHRLPVRTATSVAPMLAAVALCGAALASSAGWAWTALLF